ncbi:nibrin isoform 2-T2 [Pholidichthys leucotaenia]
MAVQQKLPPPKAENFIPEIDEPSLNKEDVNLKMIQDRKQLFSGKTFIFLNAKQLKRLSAAVSFGGGRSQLLEEGFLPQDLLESPQSCVVDVVTGSSQTLLPASSTEWVNSVKSIIERKGLRVIIESEIGLATIYASCGKYCNPTSSVGDSDSVSKLKPQIPSPSLSQSIAVDETVLPAASQNITAYAVNTEPTQGMQKYKVTGVTTVGETPEKAKSQSASQLCGSSVRAQKTNTLGFVAETVSSSFNTAESKDSQRKKPDSKQADGASLDFRSQPSTPWTNSGMKTSFFKQSPQKSKISAQTSPQKQSTLTTFFQPVGKKRPLQDELSAVMSEPKRPTLESSTVARTSDTSPEEIPSCSHTGHTAASQASLSSGPDMFKGLSEAALEEPRGKKRRETEEEIPVEELESLMSEDMDFEEKSSINHGQQAQLVHSSAKKKQVITAESSPSSKRQRVHREEDVMSKDRLQVGLEKESSLRKKHSPSVSIKTELVHPTDYMSVNQESRKPPQLSASTSKDAMPFEDDEASFIEDAELLKVDVPQANEETQTPPKPVRIKQEVQESNIDEALPKNLLLVEFRSLTVAAPPKSKPKPMQENGYTTNFKCFRKKRVPGTVEFPHIIGASDLLVHNRGRNSDLDEWLKDAAEEERQIRRDETLGDDLFRYNPTKLTKRR